MRPSAASAAVGWYSAGLEPESASGTMSAARELVNPGCIVNWSVTAPRRGRQGFRVPLRRWHEKRPLKRALLWRPGAARPLRLGPGVPVGLVSQRQPEVYGVKVTVVGTGTGCPVALPRIRSPAEPAPAEQLCGPTLVAEGPGPFAQGESARARKPWHRARSASEAQRRPPGQCGQPNR